MSRTDREYARELEHLREQLLLMAARVESMLDSSVRALIDEDTRLASRIIAFDDQVNRLEVAVDEQCLCLLARRQPVASDLRLVTASFKVVTNLERLGDLAKGICRRIVEMDSPGRVPPTQALLRLAEMAVDLLHLSVDAFASNDPVCLFCQQRCA